MVEEPPIRGCQTFTEADAMFPAEGMQPADVEQLSRRPIGLAGVEAERRLRIDDIPQRLSKLTYREVFTGADVDVADLLGPRSSETRTHQPGRRRAEIRDADYRFPR